MLSNLFNVCSHHDRIPFLACPKVAGPSSLGSALWAKRIFAEISAFKCFDVPIQPLETLGFLPVMRAEGRYPCNGINPVYLFLFIVLKYEMFALYNHPPPDVAQRSSASTIPSVNPKRRCLRRQLNRPSGTRKQTRLKS